MSAGGKFTQYINPIKTGPMIEFERKTTEFIHYLSKLGIIASQNDAYIVKRRFNILCKELKDQFVTVKTRDHIYSIDESNIDKVFEECSVNILTGFFEDRPDELAQGLLDGWRQSIIKMEEQSQKTDKLKAKTRELLSNILQSFNQRIQKQALFSRWKEAALTNQIELLKNENEAEKKKFEEKNINLQIKIREQCDYILELEDRLKNEMQDKKKKKDAAAKRKKMKKKNREVSMSLSQARASRYNNKSLNVEDPYMVAESSSRKIIDLEKHIYIKSKRESLGVDERGSVNTLAAQRRYSLATASITSQGFGSEFSFHPEINRESKWKPKYDDHHDHVKMWERMHDENRKIHAKRRLLSQEKELREIEGCTFTPNLISKQNGNDRDEPLNIEKLSERMYEYASKFKENKEQIKRKYENESGASFTPKINKKNVLSTSKDERNVLIQRKLERVTKTKSKKKQITPKHSSYVATLNIGDEVQKMSMTIYKKPYAEQVIRDKTSNTERNKKSQNAQQNTDFVNHSERGCENFTKEVNKIKTD